MGRKWYPIGTPAIFVGEDVDIIVISGDQFRIHLPFEWTSEYLKILGNGSNAAIEAICVLSPQFDVYMVCW